MTYVAGIAAVRQRTYDVYIRTATTITLASDANFKTLRDLMQNIGKCERGAVKVTTVGDKFVTMNDGSQKPKSFKGNLEIKHLNTSVANGVALNAFENTYVDLIFDDQTEDLEHNIVIKNVLLWIDEEAGDGEVLVYTLKADKEVNTKAEFRQYGSYDYSAG